MIFKTDNRSDVIKKNIIPIFHKLIQELDQIGFMTAQLPCESRFLFPYDLFVILSYSQLGFLQEISLIIEHFYKHPITYSPALEIIHKIQTLAEKYGLKFEEIKGT